MDELKSLINDVDLMYQNNEYDDIEIDAIYNDIGEDYRIGIFNYVGFLDATFKSINTDIDEIQRVRDSLEENINNIAKHNTCSEIICLLKICII